MRRKDEAPGLYGIPSLYPTPPSVARELLTRLPIQPGETILEPSAGTAAMAKVIAEELPHNPLYVIERHPQLAAQLVVKGFELIALDFLAFEGAVDWVVQNPPFSNGYQDIDHFCHAWRVARKGVVSILHEYSGFTKVGSTRYKPTVFQNWLKRQGLHKEMLPANSFLDSEMPSPVSTCVVWGIK